jgi:hypothetical protein
MRERTSSNSRRVEESCSQAVVMSSILFRFRIGNSFTSVALVDCSLPTKFMCSWLIKTRVSIGDTISRTRRLRREMKFRIFPLIQQKYLRVGKFNSQLF